MSFIINGVTWTPETASQHATDLLTGMNALLAEQGLDPVVATQANALWLAFLAIGSKLQNQDDSISGAINALGLDTASGPQIVNLLPIAGTQLQQGAYSYVIVTIIANGTGSVTIPAGLAMPLGPVNFTAASGIVVPPSGTGFVLMVCDTIGPVAVAPGQLTKFATPVSNLLSATNPASAILGRNPETDDQARVRLEQGQVIGWNLDGLTRALSQIQGITQSRVYFNFNTTTPEILPGGITVDPRHILMIVEGYDSTGVAIASTYAELMCSPTNGTISQQFTYANGQVINVSYIQSTNENVYVLLVYDSNSIPNPGFLLIAEAQLSTISFSIGQVVSTETILTALGNFQYASIIDAQVSTDGITWMRKITFGADKVPVVVSVVGTSG